MEGKGPVSDEAPSYSELEKIREILTAQQISDLREAFNVFDKDRDGYINPRKLGQVMKSLGWNPTEAEVQDLIVAVDEDGNGQIEFEEFCQMMAEKLNQKDGEATDDLKEAFSVFDRDGNGEISVEDLTGLLGKLGQDFTQEEIEAMVSAADLDGDKVLSYKDFVNVYKDD